MGFVNFMSCKTNLMKIKVALLIFSGIFLANNLFSQFKPGYIITNSNDTVKGYLNFEGSAINCNQCTFISMPDSVKHFYLPGEIKAFRFSGSKYYMTEIIRDKNKTEKVFLEWLVKGRASMLAYNSPDMKARYFILPENDTLTELVNTVKTIIAKDVKTTNNQNIQYQHSQNEYIGTLLYYLRDCPPLTGKIQTTPLSSGSLIKIAKEYQAATCPGVDCEFFEDKQRGLKVDALLSLSYLSSRFILNNGLAENAPVVGSPGIGLGLNVSNLPVLPAKFSFSMRVDYYNLTYKYDTNLYYVHDDRICNIKYLRIPWQVNYNFSYKRFSPFISIGASTNLRFGYKEFDEYLPRVVRNNLYEILKMSVLQIGLTGGAGVRYSVSDKFIMRLGIDYEHDFRFYGTYVTEQSYINNLYFGLSLCYRLN
jgi:hypothetical protein